jgi:hypothetical protein
MKAAVRRLVRADPGDRWAAVFGRIAVYSFLVALVSGIFLLPFFRPSMTPVVWVHIVVLPVVLGALLLLTPEGGFTEIREPLPKAKSLTGAQ